MGNNHSFRRPNTRFIGGDGAINEWGLKKIRLDFSKEISEHLEWQAMVGQGVPGCEKLDPEGGGGFNPRISQQNQRRL